MVEAFFLRETPSKNVFDDSVFFLLFYNLQWLAIKLNLKVNMVYIDRQFNEMQYNCK